MMPFSLLSASMPASSPEIWPIPTEIVEQVLSLCHPRDVASFAQTSRAAWSLANGSTNQHLWRQLFLLFPFDDPRKTRQGVVDDILFDWKTELQRRVQAETIARSDRSSPEDLHAALVVILGVVQSASPVALGYEDTPSPNLRWVMDILESTNMLQSPSFTRQYTTQTLSHLRSYLALTLDDYTNDHEGRLRIKPIRSRSRRQVYDLDNYNGDNDWGPFVPGTRDVNWFHVECMVNIIVLNFGERGANRSQDTTPPRGLEATRAYSAPNATTLSPRDWAGVEGNWCRIVSFMDHRDLFAFNFFIRGHLGHVHGGSFFEDLHFAEATILMELKFRLISPDAIPNYYILDQFPPSKDANYPTLYFSGSFRKIEAPDTVMVGSVHMDYNGVVRWRFGSVHADRMQWSSEGIQMGGIASAMGVVGIWTGAHHQRGDPAGPFWLWKVPEEE